MEFVAFKKFYLTWNVTYIPGKYKQRALYVFVEENCLHYPSLGEINVLNQ